MVRVIRNEDGEKGLPWYHPSGFSGLDLESDVSDRQDNGEDEFETPRAVRAVTEVQRGRIDEVLDRERNSVLPDPVLETLQGPDVAVVRHQGPSSDYLEELRSIAKRDIHARSRGVLAGQGVKASIDIEGSAAWNSTSVSQSTIDAYTKRANQLFSRYVRESNLPGGTDISGISLVYWVNWALSLKSAVRPSTWRQYRQSLLHCLSGMVSEDAGEAIALLATDIRERSVDAYAGRRTRQIAASEDAAVNPEEPRRKTSSLKEKRFPKHDFDRIRIWLRTHSRSRRARALSHWLQAGLLTGLRPSEWRAVYLDVVPDERTIHGRRVRLYVLNAKATNGRGPGDTIRTLDLSHFSDKEIFAVRQMADLGRLWSSEDRFKLEQAECAKLLTNVVRRLWPGRKYRYSLYSCRHQAIANWKSVMSRERVAALAGHGSIVTAAENYARRRSAWIPEAVRAPQPIASELDLMSRRTTMSRQREENRRAAFKKKGPDANPFT